MTILSIGFDGSVPEGAWARLAPTLGKIPHVIEATAFKVSTVSGVDRTVSVAPGGHSAFGVRADSDATVTVQLGTVATGVRWDTIAVRRNWAGAGGTTTVVGLPGGAARALAPGLTNDPGATTADTAVALVQVTAGVQVPTAVVDLRVNGAGQALTVDGATQWGLPVADSGWVTVSFGASYPAAPGATPRVRAWQGRTYLEGAIVRVAGNDFVEGVAYSWANVVPVGRRPDRLLVFFASRRSDGNIDARVVINPDGSVDAAVFGDSGSIRFDNASWFPAA